MKKYFVIFVAISCFNLSAQKDSLQLGDSYLEDQLYFGVSFNQLYKQPISIAGSGFSYGLSTGYIKDISIVQSGKIALGIGIGYAFDSYNHGYKVTQLNNNILIEVDANNATRNGMKLHSIEFPFEFRWRTSTANKYKFWRIYTGFKISYHFKNSIDYTSNSIVNSYENIDRINKTQYGFTLAAGYSTFNFSLYYGITPLFKDASVGTQFIDTKVLKLGLMFYIL